MRPATGPLLELRDYQREAVREAHDKNLLVVLPTNTGKTIIACEVIKNYVASENSCERLGPARKIVFLAPSKPLARQQKQVLLDNVPALQEEEAHTTSADATMFRSLTC